jgi:hypothetical protein
MDFNDSKSEYQTLKQTDGTVKYEKINKANNRNILITTIEQIKIKLKAIQEQPLTNKSLEKKLKYQYENPR